MARDHITAMFSGAYDDALSARDAARFHAHLEQCAQCAADYDVFRQSVDAVRALPAAPMPRPVHVPSTPPVAEQPTIASRLRGMRMPRLIPGAATGIAAVAAAVILVLATRQGNGGTPNSLGASGLAPQFAGPSNGVASCPTILSSEALAAPPAAYQHRVSASDPGRPGQQLVLASETGSAAPGSQVLVFAQLTVPRSSAAQPGANATASSVGALPCITVDGIATSLSRPNSVAHEPNQSAAAALGSGADAASAASVEAFTIPASTPRGTVLRIVATVPPDFPQQGDPPLTIDLLITVQ